MVSIEEAYKKAAEARHRVIDYCDEFEDAYMFGCEADEMSDGGIGYVPVIVLKDDGTVIGVTQYVLKTYRDLEEEVIAHYSVSVDKITKK